MALAVILRGMDQERVFVVRGGLNVLTTAGFEPTAEQLATPEAEQLATPEAEQSAAPEVEQPTALGVEVQRISALDTKELL